MANTSEKREKLTNSLLWNIQHYGQFIVKLPREYHVCCNICRAEFSIDNEAQFPGHKSTKPRLIILGYSNASGKC